MKAYLIRYKYPANLGFIPPTYKLPLIFDRELALRLFDYLKETYPTPEVEWELFPFETEKIETDPAPEKIFGRLRKATDG